MCVDTSIPDVQRSKQLAASIADDFAYYRANLELIGDHDMLGRIIFDESSAADCDEAIASIPEFKENLVAAEAEYRKDLKAATECYGMAYVASPQSPTANTKEREQEFLRLSKQCRRHEELIELWKSALQNVVTFRDKHNEALALISNGLKEDDAELIAGMNAHKAFLALKARHEGSIHKSRRAAQSKLAALRLSSDASAQVVHFVDDHQSLSTICEWLFPAGSPDYSDEAKKIDIGLRLPFGFIDMKTIALVDKNLSYDEFCLNIKARAQDQAYIECYGQDDTIATAQSPRNTRNHSKKARPAHVKKACWHCQRPGHSAIQCNAPGAKDLAGKYWERINDLRAKRSSANRTR